MAGALDGIRVLDIAQVAAGPLCSTLLGDLGADVIKIEPPEGDAIRFTGETFVGQSRETDGFISLNRNKRSVVVDLKTEAGKQFLRALAATVDVVVENYKPGTMERLGVGYEVLKADNPGLIYCSINGFGDEGPNRDRPAMDQIIQAESGMMQLTGTEESGPLRTGFPFADLLAPAHGAIGILAALHDRHKTGLGQRIDISMLNVAIFAMMPREGYFFATGKTPARIGNKHYQIVPCNTYRTQDGRDIMIMAHTEKLWLALMKGIADAALAQDPRFTSNALRVKNRDALEQRLIAIFGAVPLQEWADRLSQAGALFARVRTLPEVFSDPKICQEMVARIDHPTAGEVSVLANPIRLSRTPASIRRAPPLLGQHNDEVADEMAKLPRRKSSSSGA